jgi:hypothetical protein
VRQMQGIYGENAINNIALYAEWIRARGQFGTAVPTLGSGFRVSR